MTTTIKIRYRQNPKIYSYHWLANSKPCPKYDEFNDWMLETLGEPATDLTDLTEGDRRWLSKPIFQNDRGYGVVGGWVKTPVGDEFVFKNKADAIMFKVCWA
jgi:hypothetical protein